VSPASIRKRETKSGVRWDVRFRLGGRGYPIHHAGTFRTMKEARERRDLVAGELAAGRDPRLLLEALRNPPVPLTFSELAERWLASRVDVRERTRESYEQRLRRLTDRFAQHDPQVLTPAQVTAWIAEMVEEGLAAGTIGLYHQTLAMVLDELEGENPARHRSVRLPRVEREEISPPDSQTILGSLSKMTLRWRLAVVTLEQTGMRLGELTGLRWEDVDVVQSRFRLPRQRTKTARPRWVPVPRWLMSVLEERIPREDRLGRVFPRIEGRQLATAIRRACKDAGVAHYSPHDLRHRRISIWQGHGVPPRQLAELVGHARSSMTLDTYSHVMALDEVPAQELERLVEVGVT